MIKKTGFIGKIGLVVCVLVLVLVISITIYNRPVEASTDTAAASATNSVGGQVGSYAGTVAGTAVNSLVTPTISTLKTFMSGYQTVSAVLSALQSASTGVGIPISNIGDAIKEQAANLRHQFTMEFQSMMAEVESGERKLAAEQQTAGMALLDQSMGDYATYGANTNAQAAKGAVNAATAIKFSNVPAALCSGYTFKAALPAQFDYARQKEEEYYDYFAGLVSQTSSTTKNGAADSAQNVRTIMASACADPVLGGGGVADPTTCMAHLLAKAGGRLSAEEAAVINPAVSAILATSLITPVALPPNFDLETATTDQLYTYWQSSANNILAGKLFRSFSKSMSRDARAGQAVSAAKYLADALRATGAFTEARIEELVPSTGLSYNDFLQAMALALNVIIVEMQSGGMDPDAAESLTADLARLQIFLDTEMLLAQQDANEIASITALLAVNNRKRNTDIAIARDSSY